MKNTHTTINSQVIKVQFISLVIFWTLIILLLYFFAARNYKSQTKELAINQARTLFKKDVAIRYWATEHGGIYVPISKHTPVSPYLSHIPFRDIAKPLGDSLTLMNPAYIIRQLQSYYNDLFGGKGHITSLKPIRPQNLPDEWEVKALLEFEDGVTEVLEFTSISNEPYIRLMQPFITEEGCLKCHAMQGYKVGDIRGGISVSAPISEYKLLEHEQIFNLRLLMGILWLIGIGLIMFSYSRIIKNIKVREKAVKAMYESEEKFQTLYNNSPDMYVSVSSEDASILQCNDTLLNRTGYTREEIIGSPIFKMYHNDCMDEVKKTFQQFVTTGTVKDNELILKRKDGSKIEVSLNVDSVKDQDGKILYSISSWRDITERKIAEAKLAKYQNNLEKLVKKRTIEIEEKNQELIKFNEAFIGREFRIKELRDEIKQLKQDKGKK